jgi:hypothetical protein
MALPHELVAMCLAKLPFLALNRARQCSRAMATAANDATSGVLHALVEHGVPRAEGRRNTLACLCKDILDLDYGAFRLALYGAHPPRRDKQVYTPAGAVAKLVDAAGWVALGRLLCSAARKRATQSARKQKRLAAVAQRVASLDAWLTRERPLGPLLLTTEQWVHEANVAALCGDGEGAEKQWEPMEVLSAADRFIHFGVVNHSQSLRALKRDFCRWDLERAYHHTTSLVFKNGNSPIVLALIERHLRHRALGTAEAQADAVAPKSSRFGYGRQLLISPGRLSIHRNESYGRLVCEPQCYGQPVDVGGGRLTTSSWRTPTTQQVDDLLRFHGLLSVVDTDPGETVNVQALVCAHHAHVRLARATTPPIAAVPPGATEGPCEHLDHSFMDEYLVLGLEQSFMQQSPRWQESACNGALGVWKRKRVEPAETEDISLMRLALALAPEREDELAPRIAFAEAMAGALDDDDSSVDEMSSLDDDFLAMDAQPLPMA